jgi:hypothetical protein
MFKEIAGALNISEDDVQVIHATIWEHNVGAVTLVNLELPIMTLRSCC